MKTRHAGLPNPRACQLGALRPGRESHGTELRKPCCFREAGVLTRCSNDPIKIFPAAVALTIGHVGYKPKLTGEGFPFPPTYTVVAADQTLSDQQNQVQSEENADESDKMGGT